MTATLFNDEAQAPTLDGQSSDQVVGQSQSQAKPPTFRQGDSVRFLPDSVFGHVHGERTGYVAFLLYGVIAVNLDHPTPHGRIAYARPTDLIHDAHGQAWRLSGPGEHQPQA